jgi:hypothetical protein
MAVKVARFVFYDRARVERLNFINVNAAVLHGHAEPFGQLGRLAGVAAYK